MPLPFLSSLSSRLSAHPRLRRALALGLCAVPALLLALAAFAMFTFRHALPDYAGHVSLQGLKAPVSVMRDDYGIPHIFAHDMNDAVRALGYLHASERFFQMEMQRRAGQGRLAEAAGPDMLGIDKFTRTLGIYRLAESSFDAMSPEAKTFFEAYAEGVNDWLATHRYALPPEFTLLGITPEPWKPADSIVWGKLMALQLSHNYKLEMLRQQLAGKISPQMMQELFPAQQAQSPITAAPRSAMPAKGTSAPSSLPAKGKKSESGRYDFGEDNPSSAKTKALLTQDQVFASSPARGEEHFRNDGLDNVLDQLGGITGLGHAASNEWTIAGSRTASGKPILANDPHLDLGAPILWYLARIDVPGFWIKGATVPGLPIFLLGQNDHIAWGFTTTYSDVEDLFIETIDPKNPEHYLTPSGAAAFTTRSETIHVKSGRDVVLNVRATGHGPVLSDIDQDMAAMAGDGKVMALSFTALMARDTTSEALMRLDRARSWDEFLSALLLYQAPPQNVVYADTAGHIGFINPGFVPVRKSGDGLTPVDGASGKFDWRGRVPFSQLPRLYDPAAGFVFNANNAVTGSDNMYFFGADWEEPYRARRIQQFFDNVPLFTPDIAAAMQADHVSIAARDLLPYLLRLSPASERAAAALDMLRGWDGNMDADRPEPLIFEAWLFEMHKILQEKTGVSLEEKGPYAASAIMAMMDANDPGLCGTDGCALTSAKALDDALDFLSGRDGHDMKKWRWGQEHVTKLKNKVFSHVPFLSGPSDLSMSSSGGAYTLDRGESSEVDVDAPFARAQGGGFRGIYDLGNPDRSRFMIATGESGHIFSKHYGDLAPLWNAARYIEINGAHDELVAKGLPELVLEPAQ